MTCLWHESTSYNVGVCELVWNYEVIHKMILVPFFQWLESPCQDVSHHVMLTMQNGFTICPFTGHQWDWLAWIMAYVTMFILYKKENIDAILHIDWPCNATELCMFIGYINYYCTCCRVAHISLNLKWLRIHTNASDFQLGTCIIQEGRLVAYFSCNWQCHSKNYTTLEQ